MVAEPAFKLSFMPFVIDYGFVNTKARIELSVHVGRRARRRISRGHAFTEGISAQGPLTRSRVQRSQTKAWSKRMNKRKGD